MRLNNTVSSVENNAGRRAPASRRKASTMSTTAVTGSDTANQASTGRRTVMLAVATLGFAVNFWAWALLSPLGPRFKETLHLTAFQQSLLVAVPVVVGSVGRIPVGALT